jgi:ribosomal protein L37E
MAWVCPRCGAVVPSIDVNTCGGCGFQRSTPNNNYTIDSGGVVRSVRHGILFRVCTTNGVKGLALWDKSSKAERFFSMSELTKIVDSYCGQ